MNLNKNSIKKLVLIFLICAADILWSAGFIYLWKTKGVVLSVKEASVNIPGIFVQNLIVEAVPILLFFLFLFRLGKNFQTEMYLKITGKMQKCTVGILGGILLALALWCLVTKADKVTIFCITRCLLPLRKSLLCEAFAYIWSGARSHISAIWHRIFCSRSCIFFPMRTGERSQCLM